MRVPRLLLILPLIVGTTVCTPRVVRAQEPPHLASLGECRLDHGGNLPDCRIAYRTAGTLNQRRDNAVLFPTWLTGRSDQLIRYTGREGLVDSTKYYVIMVDALGNGASSSPSNTPAAPFPEITIGDMVESQYRLLTEHLGISRLHAVVGVSMGANQAFEWAARYPAFVDRFVPIAGTPRPAAYDRILFTAVLAEFDIGTRYGVPPDTMWLQVQRIWHLGRATPSNINEIDAAAIADALTLRAATTPWRRSFPDLAVQMRATLAHDVYPRMTEAKAREVGPRMFLVYSPDDHVVTAGPAIDFAQRFGAATLAIPSRCGHDIEECELPAFAPAVREFLARKVTHE